MSGAGYRERLSSEFAYVHEWADCALGEATTLQMLFRDIDPAPTSDKSYRSLVGDIVGRINHLSEAVNKSGRSHQELEYWFLLAADSNGDAHHQAFLYAIEVFNEFMCAIDVSQMKNFRWPTVSYETVLPRWDEIKTNLSSVRFADAKIKERMAIQITRAYEMAKRESFEISLPKPPPEFDQNSQDWIKPSEFAGATIDTPTMNSLTEMRTESKGGIHFEKNECGCDPAGRKWRKVGRNIYYYKPSLLKTDLPP